MKFVDLVDIGELRGICESFTAVTGAVTAILDLEGNVLVATGWQDICTRFHRVDPRTAARCRESDTQLASQLMDGEMYNIYQCKNGLVDVAVPIRIGGEHVANFFTGQFFFEPPDLKYFLRQAQEFDFNDEAYLAALHKAPIFNAEQVESMMAFFTRLAQVMGEMGLSKNRLLQANAALQISESRYRQLIEQAPDAIVVFDVDLNRFVDANRSAEKLFACTREELLRTGPQRFYPEEQPDHRSVEDSIREHSVRALADEQVTLERAVRCADGRSITCEVRLTRLPGDRHRLIRASYIDISDRKRAELVLRESHNQLRLLVDNSPLPMIIATPPPEGRHVLFNARFIESFGYTVQDIPDIAAWWTIVYPDPAYRRDTQARWRESMQQMAAAGRDSLAKPFFSELTCKDGRCRSVEINLSIHAAGCLVMINDITERKQAEEQIKSLAFFDQLTGLPNRTLLMDRLKQALAACSRSQNFGALLFIDLDNFKRLNDTRGHEMGDLLLKQVAQRLKECIREGDTAARVGGDEFVMVLSGLGEDQRRAALVAESVAEKILAVLNQPYPIKDAAHRNSASLGVTLFRDQTLTIDDLMKQADLAMYRAKDSGRSRIRFFDPAMEAVVKQRAEMEDDLRLAVAEQQFLLYYQPQVGSDGAVTGAEALVRWLHPQRGMIAPGEFIPLAEESDLILLLGHWVLRTACAQLTRWAAMPDLAALTIAVNVSAQQFRQSDFVDQILAVIEETGANPQRLKLELTESLLVHDVEEIIGKMTALKARGIGFSLDDFGTGYSSLVYLKRLPLDQLKIDQSFVRDLLNNPNDAAIARTIVALAQSLGLAVIAEGVETPAQQEFLANSGCHSYQGYLFSRPVAIAAFEALVRKVSVC